MQVRALVGDEVIFVAPETTLREVAEALTANGIGIVAVGSHNRPVAVVSERDITRAVSQSLDPDRTTAADIAHRELVWCDATTPIAEVAAEMMDRYVRHALVESNGKLVGLVSARDLLGYYAASEDVEPDE